MAGLKVVARLVDGGEMDFNFPASALRKLEALKARGLRGKALIHAWITDDWAPPPVLIRISGHGPDGQPINRVIEYD